MTTSPVWGSRPLTLPPVHTTSRQRSMSTLHCQTRCFSSSSIFQSSKDCIIVYPAGRMLAESQRLWSAYFHQKYVAIIPTRPVKNTIQKLIRAWELFPGAYNPGTAQGNYSPDPSNDTSFVIMRVRNAAPIGSR